MADPQRRKEYSRKERLSAERDPIALFRSWYGDASGAGLLEPNAMAFATATRAGVVSVRMLLLKGFDEGGFVFFTNYESRKAREIEENPHGALVFYWDLLERQVRVSGLVSKTSREESEEYFKLRPRGAQIGAHISRQSAPLSDPSILIAERARLEAEFAGREIPCPANWGGYRLVPEEMEFWLGAPDRLHERLRFDRVGESEWQVQRLFP